jgi:hypothetical protein
MKNSFLFIILVINFFFLVSPISFSQNQKPNNSYINQTDLNPCLFDSVYSNKLLSSFGPGWGFNYSNLIENIQSWKNNPYINVDSVGSSVQGRGIWQLTITSKTASQGKKRIWIHARTHPNEIQSWWVTKEIIDLLSGENDFGDIFRNNFIFNIIPMYNPDGVELNYPRENAHGIDIESNWNTSTLEPEVIVLKNQFLKNMNSSSPILLALNMHSSYNCKRFFVYHHENGSSAAFALNQQSFIRKVKNNFPNGIEDWNYSISWLNAPGLQYPEGWLWTNYKEKVLALTYEDMNCSTASEFTKTANAILRGVAEYLDVPFLKIRKIQKINDRYVLEQNYPNPFNSETKINISVPRNSNVQVKVFNSLGQEISVLFSGFLEKGNYSLSFESKNYPSGIYLYQMITADAVLSRKMIVLK